jgi:hypothetical protein
MDRVAAKQILSAYRSEDRDWADPIFRDALAQMESDTDLKEWFDAQIDLDRAIRQKLAGIAPPADLQGKILANLEEVRAPRLAVPLNRQDGCGAPDVLANGATMLCPDSEQVPCLRQEKLTHAKETNQHGESGRCPKLNRLGWLYFTIIPAQPPNCSTVQWPPRSWSKASEQKKSRI